MAFLPVTAPGAAAEYVAAPAEALAAAPRAVELADAAALPSAGLTAWQSLFEHAGLRAGQSILINGAGGAVGGYAVQLARQAGATVTATASARSVDRVRSYGADRIIDYTATPLPAGGGRAAVRRGAEPGAHRARRRPRGWRAWPPTAGPSSAPPSPTSTTPGAGSGWCPCSSRSDAAQLAELVGRVDAGDLQIDVAARRPLTELAEVHDEAVAGHAGRQDRPDPLTVPNRACRRWSCGAGGPVRCWAAWLPAVVRWGCLVLVPGGCRGPRGVAGFLGAGAAAGGCRGRAGAGRAASSGAGRFPFARRPARWPSPRRPSTSAAAWCPVALGWCSRSGASQCSAPHREL